MTFRKLSWLAAAVGAALAVAGLAGCDSKIGAAAVVGGHHIRDSEVSSYLTAAAIPFTVQTNTGAPATIVPRSYVLTALIREQLFTKALQANGGVPSSGDINSTEQQFTQGAPRAQQQKQYTKYGFKASFAAVDLRDSALETILAQRVKATSDPKPLLDAINNLHAGITVSGRYGTWDPSQLSVSSRPSDGAPSFVQLNVSAYGNQAPSVPTG